MTGQAGQGSHDTKARPGSRRVAQWTRDYVRLPGIPDEFIGADGAPRAGLEPVFRRLCGAGPRRYRAPLRRGRPPSARSRRHLSRAGRDRRQRLVAQPRAAADRRHRMATAGGISQRAELLELVLRDLYGEGRLVAEGELPAAAIAGSAEYLRAVCGVTPPGGRYLHLYAADIGRGPDGRWWVLGDRTQAPSGAGYALENRLVLSRAFTALYKSMNVERVAPFFEAFRDQPARQRRPRRTAHRPADARHLQRNLFRACHAGALSRLPAGRGRRPRGRGDRVHIRTVAGLKRLDVLLRRVDSDFLDPLELDASSHLGVPGLIDVLRKGGVVVANMPGTGRAGIPRAARLPAESLPAPARRGPQDAPHRHLVVRPAVGARGGAVAARRFRDRGRLWPRRSRLHGSGPVLAGELSASERERLKVAIADRGIDYVGQELVRLSTTPVWDNGGLAPRPFVLRVFAAATPDGWTVMPGGFCRIAERLDARAVSMGDGARAADVWVVSDKTVRSDPAAGGRHGADPAHRRRAAEPRRRQSVLARPLSRTRRGDAAAGARARRAAARSRQGRTAPRSTRSSASRGCWSTWGATAQTTRTQPAKIAAEALQARGEFRLGAVAVAQRPAHRDLAARAAVARRLAGHHRNGRAPGADGRGRRRRHQRRRTDPAGAGELSQAWRRRT